MENGGKTMENPSKRRFAQLFSRRWASRPTSDSPGQRGGLAVGDEPAASEALKDFHIKARCLKEKHMGKWMKMDGDG